MGLLDPSFSPGSWTESVPATAIFSLLAGGATAFLCAPLVVSSPRAARDNRSGAALPRRVLAPAAAVGRWRSAGLRRTEPKAAAALFSRLLVAAAWLAPLALLGATRSWWTLPVAAAFGPLAAALFQALPSDAVGASVGGPEPHKAFLLLPEALPETRRRAVGAKLATFTAYCGGAVALLGDLALAALLAAVAGAIVSWFGLSGSGAHIKGTIGLALAATILALLPETWMGYRRYAPPLAEGVAEGESLTRPPGLHAGVVLLTNTKLEPPFPAPPMPRPPTGNPLTPAKLVSIVFSGEYWYFFWPLRRPGENSVRKYGDPISLTYTAVDRSSLVMQARQPITPPIELRCCSAIDVALRSREPQPETVYVELALIDSSRADEPKVSLGVQELAPTMRFSIPLQREIQAFDEILVWFHLDESRRHRSANLSIERFDLLR